MFLAPVAVVTIVTVEQLFFVELSHAIIDGEIAFLRFTALSLLTDH